MSRCFSQCKPVPPPPPLLILPTMATNNGFDRITKSTSTADLNVDLYNTFTHNGYHSDSDYSVVLTSKGITQQDESEYAEMAVNDESPLLSEGKKREKETEGGRLRERD